MNPVSGYIGLTDPHWYEFLSSNPRVDEVNFWQPHGNRNFRAIRSGDLFFFKLRAPLKAIAGFGFFHRFETLPAWLAWDCFGTMNGAPDFGTMVRRISRLRGDKQSEKGEFSIGCIMITAPVFFDRSQWIEPPRDWAKTGIQQGKTYDLNSGEGLRIFRECLERANSGGCYWNVDKTAEDPARYGGPIAVCPRLGQGLFKREIQHAYAGACAVTGEHSIPALEAAHIIPYSEGGEHRVDNGLFLRIDLHRLYDKGYVTVTPDYKFKVGESLREDYKNGRSYYAMNGQQIAVPASLLMRPDRDRLKWHQDNKFRG